MKGDDVTHFTLTEVVEADGAVRQFRVLWAEKPREAGRSGADADGSSVWVALRAVDADTGEELVHVSVSLFRSQATGRHFTFGPKTLPPGTRP